MSLRTVRELVSALQEFEPGDSVELHDGSLVVIRRTRGLAENTRFVVDVFDPVVEDYNEDGG